MAGDVFKEELSREPFSDQTPEHIREHRDDRVDLALTNLCLERLQVHKFIDDGWTPMHTDMKTMRKTTDDHPSGTRIRVYPCPSVVKKFSTYSAAR